MRQRIELGKSVKVYKSPSMPRPQTFKPISVATLDVDYTVAKQIDDNQQ